MTYEDMHIFLLGTVPNGLVNHILAYFGEPELPWYDGHDSRSHTTIRVVGGTAPVVSTNVVAPEILQGHYRRAAGFSSTDTRPIAQQVPLDGFEAPPDTSLWLPYLAPEGLSSYDLLWHAVKTLLPGEIYRVVAEEIRRRRSAEQRTRYYADPSRALRRAERERKRMERAQQGQQPKRPRGRPKGSKTKPK